MGKRHVFAATALAATMVVGFAAPASAHWGHEGDHGSEIDTVALQLAAAASAPWSSAARAPAMAVAAGAAQRETRRSTESDRPGSSAAPFAAPPTCAWRSSA